MLDMLSCLSLACRIPDNHAQIELNDIVTLIAGCACLKPRQRQACDNCPLAETIPSLLQGKSIKETLWMQ